MWFFSSPQIVFGEGALSYLAQIHGKRAYIITDEMMSKFGFVDLVKAQLAEANIETRIFAEVEPEPCLDTVRRGAQLLCDYGPDWIVGLGGGSAMDAAKAMWALYERPDLPPDGINPLEYLGLGKKAKLITISTTSGTGSEVTWFTVLSDTNEKRKLGLGSRETLATIAIVDPVFALKMPPRLTADTGLDALTHAIEGYTGTWHNDFADSVSLKAIDLVFKYLPKAYADGNDTEAREKMHNAAALAGLGFGNSMAALAHAMGHSLGAVFHVPHGRAVSLFLPYTMEFAANAGNYRYADIARFIGLNGDDDKQLSYALIAAVRALAKNLDSNANIQSLGITRNEFSKSMEHLLFNAENDNQIVPSSRQPDRAELEKLFWYAYEGRSIDF
ncbi:MAG: iron-containing alcohol dehydrogenase [Chloroflexi bacterium]|nr:iron-containing alcohol dehydrogenase [Chloroflexota bacterium]